MKPRVAGSVSSPVEWSIFVLTRGMMISGLVKARASRIDEDVAQVKLRPEAPEQRRRSALNRDRFAGERLIGQP